LWGLLALSFAYSAWRALKERAPAQKEIPLDDPRDPPARS